MRLGTKIAKKMFYIGKRINLTQNLEQYRKQFSFPNYNSRGKLKIQSKMGIDRYLMRDEQIIARVKAGKTEFYATNKRIMRYEKKIFSEKADFLVYDHIQSISLEEKNIRGYSYWELHSR